MTGTITINSNANRVRDLYHGLDLALLFAIECREDADNVADEPGALSVEIGLDLSALSGRDAVAVADYLAKLMQHRGFAAADDLGALDFSAPVFLAFTTSGDAGDRMGEFFTDGLKGGRLIATLTYRVRA